MTIFENNKLFILLAILILLDIITGVIGGIINKKINSKKWRNGGFKKILIIVVVISSRIFDIFYFTNDILYNVTVCYYIINEMISITENANKCGLPIPKKLVNILSELKEKED